MDKQFEYTCKNGETAVIDIIIESETMDGDYSYKLDYIEVDGQLVDITTFENAEGSNFEEKCWEIAAKYADEAYYEGLQSLADLAYESYKDRE